MTYTYPVPIRKYYVSFAADAAVELTEQECASNDTPLAFLLSCVAVRQDANALRPTFDIAELSRRNQAIKGARKCS